MEWRRGWAELISIYAKFSLPALPVTLKTCGLLHFKVARYWIKGFLGTRVVEYVATIKCCDKDLDNKTVTSSMFRQDLFTLPSCNPDNFQCLLVILSLRFQN